MEVIFMKSKTEKKIVTLEKYYKTKLIGSLCGFVLTLILIISNGIMGTDTPLWMVVPLALTVIPFIVCFALVFAWEAEKRVEKHDELSLQMLNKAHSQMFNSFSGLMAVTLIVSTLWTDPVQISLDGNLFFIIFMCFYTLYNACESGFFLQNEKKSGYESEDSDE